MSIYTPPPAAPPKKRGCGCFGCGCSFLVLLAILAVALVGGLCYMGYNKALALTSTTPANIPSVTTTDDALQTTRQKITDFYHDLKDHKPSTLQLSADEINALIAHDPNVAKYNIHALVTFTGDEGQVQASVPASLVNLGQDRYFNLNASFGVSFDITTKSINVALHSLQCGDNILVSPTSGNPQATLIMMTSFNQSFNAAIRKNPDGATLLDQAKSVEIQNSQLVIQTQ